MFTAIITAMLGLFWLSWLGTLDLSLVPILPTYRVPQLAGGLIFGVGFVMGGYCPGTCVVASASGKMDGWIHLVGMFGGILLFGELYPLADEWYSLTPMGEITLSQLFGFSHGFTMLFVVLLALGGFVVAERVEARYRKRN